MPCLTWRVEHISRNSIRAARFLRAILKYFFMHQSRYWEYRISKKKSTCVLLNAKKNSKAILIKAVEQIWFHKYFEWFAKYVIYWCVILLINKAKCAGILHEGCDLFIYFIDSFINSISCGIKWLFYPIKF